MKSPLFRRILLIAALGATLCPGQSSQEGAPEELKRLPMVALDRKGEFPAEFSELPGAGAGLRKFGFAFRTPPLIEGPATWLVVWDHDKPEDAKWEVTFANGKPLAVVAPALDDLRLYPELAEKFPAGKSVQRLRVPQHLLNKWDRYQAVVTTQAETPPLGILINAAAGGIVKRADGGNREIAIPEGSIASARVMELVENIRALKGDAAAIAFLEDQFAQKAERRGDFESLFGKVWDEAQFGAGKGDSVWGSMLNDAAFTAAHGIGHHARAFDILNNLCATLGGSARFGRLAEVHAIFEDAYRKGGWNMDTSSYPDLGPAIPGLPAVRRREIPTTHPYAKQAPPGPPPISGMTSFNEKQTGVLLNYAYQRTLRGDWKGGLEWMVWVRDWAADKDGNPVQPRNSAWYSATFSIAMRLEAHGFTEDALAMIERAVAAPYGRTYRGRDKINAERMLLGLKLEAGRPDPETASKLHGLIGQIEGHIHMGGGAVRDAKFILAKLAFHEGRHAEGDAMLEELVREGHYSSRWKRLSRWIETGRTEGVEAELIHLLSLARENGHKIFEPGIYGMYADFLEKAGRFREALAMRREAIRLCREFDVFAALPSHLAKLAVLLAKLGDAENADKAAAEARRLLNESTLSPSTVESVRKILAEMETAAPAAPPARQPDIDLQPHRGLVIPLEGAPWTSYLTLANPGAAAVRGTLEISGAPLAATADAETGDIRVELGAAGATALPLTLTLTPASYRLITVASAAVEGGDGGLIFTWKSEAADAGDEATLLIDAREQGVAGAVIQAGEYRANPFYGVPIHLGYVAKDRRAKSSPLRFRASQVARIEIHHLDGTLLAIDGTGNGSLLDPGDQLFAETDGAGNLLLGLAEGAAALRILAYPQGQIAADGLRIDIEAFEGGGWSLHSSNRIDP